VYAFNVPTASSGTNFGVGGKMRSECLAER
jgi:hypothetical protein